MSDRPSENILSDIGDVMIQLGDTSSDKYYLYFEMEEGVLSPELFQEFDYQATWVDPAPLCNLLSELWYASSPNRWGALRYELDGDNFSAKFDYDVHWGEHTHDRQTAAMKAHFGDKPLTYRSEEESAAERRRHRALFG